MNKLSFKIAQSGVYQTATQTPNFNARSTDDENHFAQVTSNIIIDDGPESEIDAQDYNQEEEMAYTNQVDTVKHNEDNHQLAQQQLDFIMLNGDVKRPATTENYDENSPINGEESSLKVDDDEYYDQFDQ